MKNLIIAFGMLIMINAQAQEMKKYQHPSAAEIAQSRACFQSLESLGCGTPDEDNAKFRHCVSQVQETLDESCQKTLSNLYGDR